MFKIIDKLFRKTEVTNSEEPIKIVKVDLDKCDPKFKDWCKRCYNKKNGLGS